MITKSFNPLIEQLLFKNVKALNNIETSIPFYKEKFYFGDIGVVWFCNTIWFDFEKIYTLLELTEDYLSQINNSKLSRIFKIYNSGEIELVNAISSHELIRLIESLDNPFANVINKEVRKCFTFFYDQELKKKIVIIDIKYLMLAFKNEGETYTPEQIKHFYSFLGFKIVNGVDGEYFIGDENKIDIITQLVKAKININSPEAN